MKIAIAGTGMIVREVLPYLAEWGWEPAAICSTPASEEKARALADQCGCTAVYTDYAAMLAETEAGTVYLGVPNVLHAQMAEQAMGAGKHVIVEKPLASNSREAEKLAALARELGLFLYEAVTTLYQPDYAALRALLPRIGEVRLVSCNFSQYSSRYDAFRRGERPPVFDPAKSGGALMDLNLYNLHWMTGLFGAPDRISYHANMERGIDVSGILLLEYPAFQAVSIAAKDCSAPARYLIQGTEGSLIQNTTANVCGEVVLRGHGGGEERFHTPAGHRMEAEFRAFAKQMRDGDLDACHAALAHSMTVSRLLTGARQYAGIRFPADGPQTENGGFDSFPLFSTRPLLKIREE